MPSIRLAWNPKHIIVQWVGIGKNTHTHIFSSFYCLPTKHKKRRVSSEKKILHNNFKQLLDHAVCSHPFCKALENIVRMMGGTMDISVHKKVLLVCNSHGILQVPSTFSKNNMEKSSLHNLDCCYE